MNITTWNVNSIRARLERVLAWVDARRPDVLCLQELKCVDAELPRAPFEERGYHLASYGQKTYNGVAIFARAPLTDVQVDLPWAGDAQARGIVATVQGLTILNLYVPNGESLTSDKYAYKLEWLDHLLKHAPALATRPAIICGDFNIAPTDGDAPAGSAGEIFCSEPERQRFRALLSMGFTDTLAKLHPEPGNYTWWDYRANGFARGVGLRIDHLLVSGAVLPRVVEVSIDIDERAVKGASDHAPVTLHLTDG